MAPQITIPKAFAETLEEHVRQIGALQNFGLREGFLSDNLNVTVAPYQGAVAVTSQKFGELWDCARTAMRVSEQLKKQGFETRVMLAKTPNGYEQNYCEAKDPTSGEWIQIDPTPWFAKINPGHTPVKQQMISGWHDFNFVLLERHGGPMLSARKVDGSFYESYLACGFKSISDRRAELGNASSQSEPKESADYTVKLWTKQDSGFDMKTVDTVALIADVLHSEKIWNYKNMHRQVLSHPEDVLRVLEQQGIVRLQLQDHAQHLVHYANNIMGKHEIPASNLSALSDIEKTNPILASQFKHDLPALVNFILNLQPSPRVFRNEKQEWDIKGARFGHITC